MKVRPVIDITSGTSFLTFSSGDQSHTMHSRGPNDVDLAVGYHAFEKCRDSAYHLEALADCRIRYRDLSDFCEFCIHELVDFALSCRRYVEVFDDRELSKKILNTKVGERRLWVLLNKIIHARRFEGRFRGTPWRSEGSFVGVLVKSDLPDPEDFEFKELAAAFLDHSFERLFTGMQQLQDIETERTIHINVDRTGEGA